MLVDLDRTKRHLSMDDDYADETIVEKIEEASSVILNYLKLEEAPDPVPMFVQSATLLAVQALFDGGDPLSDVVVRLLHRYRDPAIA
jgi:hypothetical protein